MWLPETLYANILTPWDPVGLPLDPLDTNYDLQHNFGHLIGRLSVIQFGIFFYKIRPKSDNCLVVSVRLPVSFSWCWELIDVTLACEDLRHPSTKGVEWVKVLNALGPLRMW